MSPAHTSVRAAKDGEREVLQIDSVSTDVPALPVDDLDRLSKINPKLVDLVMEETRRNADFRRKMVEQELIGETQAFRCGQNRGFAIAGLAIILAGYALYSGHPNVACTLGATVTVPIAIAFLKKVFSKSA